MKVLEFSRYKQARQKRDRFSAALEWLLAEIEEPVSLASLREMAQTELENPRDDIHRSWAQLFLDNTADRV